MDIPWSLFRKGALALFGIALLAGLASTALYMGHRLAGDAWRITMALALTILTSTSAILIPGVILPSIRSPHPEFLADDLADEWVDLRQRRIARPHLIIAGAGIVALAYLWFLFYYGKLMNAIWFGWLPVGVAAIGLSLLLVAFARRTDWYNNRYYETPTWVIFVAFGGFAVALFLGITMTEQRAAPQRDPALVEADEGIDYTYVGTRAYYITRQYLGSGGPVPDVDLPDCDSDACGYLVLAVLFVLLTLILVAGAALIPHMWVLSGLVLLTLIALLVLHEVRRDRSLRARYRNASTV